MKPNPVLAVFSLALMTVFTSRAIATDASKRVTETNDADQILRQMSAKLSGAHTLSFVAHREVDPGLLEGRDVLEKARVTVAVQRPNKITGRAVGKAGARRFVADGNTVTLLDEKKNVYATVPMRTTIDGLVDQLEVKYGFVPPLADFAVSNPYREIRQQARTVTYLGREKTTTTCPFGCGGVECHRIGLKGKVADAELWIGVGDQLPRKLVATFHRTGQPQLRINFSKWDLAAGVTASEFAFTPPHDAQKIEMWTVAKMQTAAKH